ncbi:hypothetical protein LTR17_004737 [Elasticomyces elasticus]|nr:hypothetical protein LTR17_004737 [Elasticomyces elasticus]
MSDMQSAARTFFTSTTFAVAGASSDPSKFGHKIFAWYLAHDLHAVPVNPTCSSITVRRKEFDTVASPLKLKDPRNTGLSVITPPPITAQLLREAKQAGIKAVWLQPGSFTDKELDYAIKEFPGAAVGGYAKGTSWGCSTQPLSMSELFDLFPMELKLMVLDHVRDYCILYSLTVTLPGLYPWITDDAAKVVHAVSSNASPDIRVIQGLACMLLLSQFEFSSGRLSPGQTYPPSDKFPAAPQEMTASNLHAASPAHQNKGAYRFRIVRLAALQRLADLEQDVHNLTSCFNINQKTLDNLYVIKNGVCGRVHVGASEALRAVWQIAYLLLRSRIMLKEHTLDDVANEACKYLQGIPRDERLLIRDVIDLFSIENACLKRHQVVPHKHGLLRILFATVVGSVPDYVYDTALPDYNDLKQKPLLEGESTTRRRSALWTLIASMSAFSQSLVLRNETRPTWAYVLEFAVSASAGNQARSAPFAVSELGVRFERQKRQITLKRMIAENDGLTTADELAYDEHLRERYTHPEHEYLECFRPWLGLPFTSTMKVKDMVGMSGEDNGANASTGMFNSSTPLGRYMEFCLQSNQNGKADCDGMANLCEKVSAMRIT